MIWKAVLIFFKNIPDSLPREELIFLIFKRSFQLLPVFAPYSNNAFEIE